MFLPSASVMTLNDLECSSAETTFVEAGAIEDVVNLTLMVFHFVFFCLSIFFNKNETSKLVRSYWYSNTLDRWPLAPLAHLKILV